MNSNQSSKLPHHRRDGIVARLDWGSRFDMPKEPDFDLAAAHRFFAAHCFNSSWPLIKKADRTPEEDDQLVALGQASLWHWTQRSDCTDQNLSIAHWLLARIYCITGRPDEANRYAQQCRRISERDGVAPYFRGCAYEACARAASIRRDAADSEKYLRMGRDVAEALEKEQERKMLLDDLATIES